jgi:predicted SprT family Zn-dependent metalloprotease
VNAVLAIQTAERFADTEKLAHKPAPELAKRDRKHIDCQRMPKPFAQLEFRFPAWLRTAKVSPKKPVRNTPDPLSDPGMTAWCQEQATSFGLPELARKVRVTWNPRMRTTAGRAWWPTRAIEMNPKLKAFDEAEIWRTLKHEFAHLLAYERCGRRRIDPHGEEWRVACAELGIAGESPYHSLPLKRRRMKRNHAYACPSCLSVITRVRPLRRAVACYPCCRKFNGGAYHDRFRLIRNDI